ncbi:MAG TPA: helix-turn-helix domain-containing protein [Chitinophagaceae bacterium]|nr:helix-turn-helix domain-containing protein [Chitinophagaceae bacterium]
MEAIIERPSAKDQRTAKAVYEKFRHARKSVKSSRREKINIVFKETRKSAELPEGAIHLLKEILQFMADGKAITLIPSDSELSTQQAADILGVSRPHLIKLLEEGKIPYRKIGSHRRILFEDLNNYDKELKQTRSERLAFLSKQAQELNLGY